MENHPKRWIDLPAIKVCISPYLVFMTIFGWGNAEESKRKGLEVRQVAHFMPGLVVLPTKHGPRLSLPWGCPKASSVFLKMRFQDYLICCKITQAACSTCRLLTLGDSDPLDFGRNLANSDSEVLSSLRVTSRSEEENKEIIWCWQVVRFTVKDSVDLK